MAAEGQAKNRGNAHDSGVYRTSDPALPPRMGRVLMFHDSQMLGVFRDPRLAAHVEAQAIQAGGDAWRDVERLGPDLIVLDPVLLGARCLEMIATLRACVPQAAVLVVTAANAAVVSQCLAAGACAATAKPVQVDELLLVVGAALHRKLFLWHDTTREKQSSVARLSERDLRIAELVTRGLRNKELAADLGLTESRVEGLLTRIFKQVEVRRRSGLVRWYAACEDGKGR